MNTDDNTEMSGVTLLLLAELVSVSSGGEPSLTA